MAECCSVSVIRIIIYMKLIYSAHYTHTHARARVPTITHTHTHNHRAGPLGGGDVQAMFERCVFGREHGDKPKTAAPRIYLNK